MIIVERNFPVINKVIQLGDYANLCVSTCIIFKRILKIHFFYVYRTAIVHLGFTKHGRWKFTGGHSKPKQGIIVIPYHPHILIQNNRSHNPGMLQHRAYIYRLCFLISKNIIHIASQMQLEEIVKFPASQGIWVYDIQFPFPLIWGFLCLLDPGRRPSTGL